MPVWPRKPKAAVLILSDQSSQFTRIAWAAFLKRYNPENSISRRRNGHSNAVAPYRPWRDGVS